MVHLATSDHLIALGSVGALLFVGWERIAFIRRDRAHKQMMRKKAADGTVDDLRQIALVAQANTEEILFALMGRPVTLLEPRPAPGLIKIVDAHGKLLAKLMPNGGNTDNPGDLLLKMAQQAGVTEKQVTQAPGGH